MNSFEKQSHENQTKHHPKVPQKSLLPPKLKFLFHPKAEPSLVPKSIKPAKLQSINQEKQFPFIEEI
jgi:hypothetical protein